MPAFDFSIALSPNLDKAKEAFRRIVADGHRAGDVIGNIRANFKTDGRDRVRFDFNELIEEATLLCGADLQKHRVAVQVVPDNSFPKSGETGSSCSRCYSI